PAKMHANAITDEVSGLIVFIYSKVLGRGLSNLPPALRGSGRSTCVTDGCDWACARPVAITSIAVLISIGRIILDRRLNTEPRFALCLSVIIEKFSLFLAISGHGSSQTDMPGSKLGGSPCKSRRNRNVLRS